MKPRMGRKKSNARTAAAWQEDPCEQVHQQAWLHQQKKAPPRKPQTPKSSRESSHTTYDSSPAYNWPTTRIPKQYEIWFAELGNHYGTCVQSGNRPVLILTNDIANRYSQTFTVIPLTSKMKKLDLPTHIVLTEAHCEMLRAERLEDSILLVEQITTIDQSALFGRLCRVISAEKKQEIEQAVARQFDMRSTKKTKQNRDENAVKACGSSMHGSNAVHSGKEV